jgi:heterodisulfide reductase subunit C2
VRVDAAFRDRMLARSGFDATACLNCGSCTALCPLGVGLVPRKLFRYVVLGAKEKVLENTESIYSCLLCQMCEANCPAGVPISENVRALRTYVGEELFGLSRGGSRA